MVAGRQQNLISHGADMEARDIVDRTPIMSAAIAGQVDAVRHLMKQGKELNRVAIHAFTPVVHSFVFCVFEFVVKLIKITNLVFYRSVVLVICLSCIKK